MSSRFPEPDRFILPNIFLMPFDLLNDMGDPVESLSASSITTFSVSAKEINRIVKNEAKICENYRSLLIKKKIRLIKTN